MKIHCQKLISKWEYKWKTLLTLKETLVTLMPS